jgi:hypothetical protein
MLDIERQYNFETVSKAAAKKGKLLAAAQFSHPQDAFLFVVLIELEQSKEFVSWIFNAQTNGFSTGHYNGYGE